MAGMKQWISDRNRIEHRDADGQNRAPIAGDSGNYEKMRHSLQSIRQML
ncbi:MAG: hypothetical protein SPE35_01055 [Butyricicoccus sp.]|nr:hypothetical protein [Butyricicoccus sp.]